MLMLLKFYHDMCKRKINLFSEEIRQKNKNQDGLVFETMYKNAAASFDDS